MASDLAPDTRRGTLPPAIAVPAALATLVLVVPLAALLARAPWNEMAGLLASEA